ncbi:MAG TPA: helix-turn-helix transcriptional regulator [Thermoanaerobaculia bacterium]
MPTLGEHLRELREKNHVSLRALASRVRITAPYLSDIELGRRHPSDRVLTDLARALRTTVDDLRRHDPRALMHEIQQRLDHDVGFAPALRRLLSRCATSDDLMRLMEK